MSSLPYSFDGEFLDHLDTSEYEKLYKTTWSQLALSVYHSEKEWPNQEDLLAHTPSLVFHGYSGFSLGQYSEFFIEPLPAAAALSFGTAGVTFGKVTPLAAHLFEAYRDEHFHGEWEYMESVRIQGVVSETVEVVLLNAIRRYADRYDVQPRLTQVGPVSWMTDEEMDRLEPSEAEGPYLIPRDIEPLRCFYYGSVNADPAASCIQYYRVLEYYAFFSLGSKIATFRRDFSLSDRDFLLAVGQMLSRDEKGPLIQLVALLADPLILSEAADAKLISAPNVQLLGNALYDFRNSIVHAKYDQRSALVVDSVIAPLSPTKAWLSILEKLAKAAIDSSSSKLKLD